MRIVIEINGRKLEMTYNGETTEHKTAFIKKLKMGDLIQMLTNNKIKSL